MSFYLNSFVALTLAIFSDNICLVDIAAHLQASLLPCPGLLMFSVSLNPWRMLTIKRAFCPLVGYLLGENSVLPHFSSLSMVAILGCESQRQAGLARISPQGGQMGSLHFQNFVSTNQATQARLPINFKL